MIVDIRYHIASLAAVFLALALGILIGTSMISSDAINEQQKKMIEGLEKEFAVLREENKVNADALMQAQEVIANQQKFNERVLPLLVSGKLEGRKIAVIDVNYNKEHDGLLSALRSAGADIQSVTVVNLGLLKDSSLSKQTAGMLGKDNSNPDEYLANLAKLLGEAVTTGAHSDLIVFLDDTEIASVTGIYGHPLQDVILIGGSHNKDENYAKIFDLNLIRSLQKAGCTVYGTEDSDVEISYMRHYQNARLTTVDNIDTAHGQLALIQAMNGYPGHYGIKETAESFLPPLQ
ncbi:MAG: copper transporter [Thermacetogeniaceae bacterium]|nr:copper transporter [Thermoanaerobacterales bacterium]NLN20909.1 copper transporter [Syntrophomonadaceae bacterium]HAF17979.1 copper transporter [Peptococcaceae bacterium]